jgi:hypothetical protein
MEELTVGVPVLTAQQEADLHELGPRVTQALHDEPITWAEWPL